MDYTTVEIKFLEQKVAALQELVEYYEGLLDHLDDMIPCLGEVIANYDERCDDE